MFKQIAAVTVMNIRSLPQRLGSSLVVVIGVACVVAVMISLLAIKEGMMQSAGRNGSPDRVIVLSSGSTAAPSPPRAISARAPPFSSRSRSGRTTFHVIRSASAVRLI